jgi:hypothetical protein
VTRSWWANLAQAARAFEDAWRRDPRAEVALRLGEVARLEGRVDDMRSWFDAAKRLEPSPAASAYIDGRLKAPRP